MKKSLPGWAIALIVVVVLALIGTAGVVGYKLGRGDSPSPAAITVPATSTPTPAESKSTTTPASSPAEEPAASTSEDVAKQATLISAISGSPGSYKAKLDYIQFLTGKDAENAAAKKGEEVVNDYYVVNDNPKLRTFPVSSGVEIVLHPGDGPQYSRTFTMAEFMALRALDGEKTYDGKTYNISPGEMYYFTIKNGEVVRIENIWVP